MEKNIKIVLNENETNERILVNLEDDFDNLEVLSLKISSTDVYRKTSSDFGVVVGRVQTANGGSRRGALSTKHPLPAVPFHTHINQQLNSFSS